jgi:hypothetical protein
MWPPFFMRARFCYEFGVISYIKVDGRSSSGHLADVQRIINRVDTLPMSVACAPSYEGKV